MGNAIACWDRVCRKLSLALLQDVKYQKNKLLGWSTRGCRWKYFAYKSTHCRRMRAAALNAAPYPKNVLIWNCTLSDFKLYRALILEGGYGFSFEKGIFGHMVKGQMLVQQDCFASHAILVIERSFKLTLGMWIAGKAGVDSLLLIT